MRKNLPKGKEEIVTRFLKIVTDAYVPPTSTGVVGGSAYCLSSDRLYLSGLTEEDVDFVLQYLFARSGLKVETVRTGDGQFFIPIPPESFSLIKREYLRLNPPTKPTVFISEESGILLNRRSKIPNYPITGKRGRLSRQSRLFNLVKALRIVSTLASGTISVTPAVVSQPPSDPRRSRTM